MVKDAQWSWMRPAALQPSEPTKMCECMRRRAVLELNGQRYCKPCAIESGEFGAEDFD